MKLFTIFAGIIGFFVLVFVVSLFFPHEYRIERSTVIKKPVYESFAYLNNIRNWQEWSPWNREIDSTMESFYSPNVRGLGATQYFRGNLVGNGRFKIIQSITNERICYDLSINQGLIHSSAVFYFKPIGANTQLFWLDTGDVGYNPVFRFMLPDKISSTEEGFEEGLRSIKHAAESKL